MQPAFSQRFQHPIQMSHSFAWTSSYFSVTTASSYSYNFLYLSFVSIISFLSLCRSCYWLSVVFNYISCRFKARSPSYVITLLTMLFTNGHIWRFLGIERFCFWVSQTKVVTFVSGRRTWIDLYDIIRHYTTLYDLFSSTLNTLSLNEMISHHLLKEPQIGESQYYILQLFWHQIHF